MYCVYFEHIYEIVHKIKLKLLFYYYNHITIFKNLFSNTFLINILFKNIVNYINIFKNYTKYVNKE